MAKLTLRSKKVQARVEEICQRIRQRFPEAEFRIYQSNEAPIYIETYTNADALWDILNLTSERATEILEQEGIFISVIPLTKKREPVTQERP